MPTRAIQMVDPQGTPLALGGAVNSVDFTSPTDGAAARGSFQLGTLAVGGMGGGGGGGAPGGYANATGEAAQTAAGMRSIRIDIPRSWQAFTFTKVLNLRSEPGH